jgi:predicted RNA-binding Zn-ribbon protein involved in translation (DUF1610 family)
MEDTDMDEKDYDTLHICPSCGDETGGYCKECGF